MNRIAHLVDDTTAGGVMRVIDHIRSCPHMALLGHHSVIELPRDSSALPAMEADVVVSHLSISWRRLPWFIRLRAALAQRPLIHVEHSYTGAFAGRNVLHRARFHTLLSTAYSLFDRVVAVSREQGGWFQAQGFVAVENLMVIQSAVDVAPFLALDPATGRPRRIGAMGRLDPQKGFDILIRAMRACRDQGLRLEVFGEGPERARLRELAAGDPRIRLRGWADPVAAMKEVDAVAMPSRWEAFGLVALEARAAGRLLLAAPVDGLKDHIADGALAVGGQGVDDWTAALDRLGATDGSLRQLQSRRVAAGAGDRFARGWGTLLAGLERGEKSVQAA